MMTRTHVATAILIAIAAMHAPAGRGAEAGDAAMDTATVEYTVLLPLDDGVIGKEIVYADRVTEETIIAVPPTQVSVPGCEGLNIYFQPYSMTLNRPDWGRFWANMGLLAGAMGGTLAVLECLPEDATSWNRKDISGVPPFTRWYRNIFVHNPEIDHDDWVFNYLLHPYAGAAYFMAARTCGFNFWRSMLTSAFVSTVLWEFGIEAFMERPSYQDIVITPVVGSVIGELFYKLKRDIVANDYRLWGSPIWGSIVAFLIDPVNELLDLFRGNPLRGYRLDPHPDKPKVTSSIMPTLVKGAPGFALTLNF